MLSTNTYLADQFRTFVIGELTEDLQKAHDCSIRIYHLFSKEAKPEVACSDLYRPALEEASRTGYPNDIKEFVLTALIAAICMHRQSRIVRHI
jgi:Xaa-Pro aminopeptidase